MTKVTTEENVYLHSSGSFTETGPALVSHAGRVWVAWTGRDRRLNVMSSADGVSFDHKAVLDERSSAQPALAVHDGRVVIAWVGGGNKINVATLTFEDSFGV
ncbi:MAG TPA: hypothetical protein VG455_11410 [Acidimicrobiales bacterium]|nr:hypothetical protein [Acidimicrobiales bacterium]